MSEPNPEPRSTRGYANSAVRALALLLAVLGVLALVVSPIYTVFAWFFAVLAGLLLLLGHDRAGKHRSFRLTLWNRH